MKLAELVSRESGVPFEGIMLLRHGNDSVAHLRQYGVSVEEYTAIQPIDSKYDYYQANRSRIKIVIVIAEDVVYGVFEVIGIDAVGTNYSIVSEAYRNFESGRNIQPIGCRKFELKLLQSIATGLPVHGWEGRTRIPVQRHDGSFFNEIEVDTSGPAGMKGSIEAVFQQQVERALKSPRDQRLQRLSKADPVPARVEVSAYVFARNPDVVAEVLHEANGVCQLCGNPAPFARRSDGSPYLEVHHRKPLSAGGLDTVENAIAMCPNCHRKAHFA